MIGGNGKEGGRMIRAHEVQFYPSAQMARLQALWEADPGNRSKIERQMELIGDPGEYTYRHPLVASILGIFGKLTG